MTKKTKDEDKQEPMPLIEDTELPEEEVVVEVEELRGQVGDVMQLCFDAARVEDREPGRVGVDIPVAHQVDLRVVDIEP